MTNCGPCGPSTRRDGIWPVRYQPRSAALDTPVSVAARSRVTQSQPSSGAPLSARPGLGPLASAPTELSIKSMNIMWYSWLVRYPQPQDRRVAVSGQVRGHAA
jgi:hypothetical protein